MLLHFKILFWWDYKMLRMWDYLQNCYILKIKLLQLWEYEKNYYFLKLKLLYLWEYLKNGHFFTESAAFPGKSHKFATFSISYVKLELFNQLLQSRFSTLVSLDCLNLFVKTYDLMTFIYKLTKTQSFFYFTKHVYLDWSQIFL